ncbi:hypothetical protein M422DRAFT_25701 [Sphaerobolus stellatus SS14]|nr:hypothetical protein M422DRAFT_25701 [Sphaerobolus stellatus SS14]
MPGTPSDPVYVESDDDPSPEVELGATLIDEAASLYVLSDVEVDTTNNAITSDVPNIVSLPCTLPLTINPSVRLCRPITLLESELDALKDGQWFNDRVMEFGLSQCLRRHELSASALKKLFIFSTYFYSMMHDKGLDSVERWTRRWDVFDQDMLIVPVHHSHHWFILAIYSPGLCLVSSAVDINTAPRTQILSMDSLGGSQPAAHKLVAEWLHNLAKPHLIYGLQWNAPKSRSLDVPIQPNFSDCGPFSLHNLARFLMNYPKILGKEITYGTRDWNLIWKPHMAGQLRKTLREQTRLRRLLPI